MKKFFCLSCLALFFNSYSQTAEELISSGNSKEKLKDYNGAVADFTKVIEIDPQNKSAYRLRGYSKISLDDYRGAIADCTKALEIDPQYDSAYNVRGIAKFYSKDYSGAIADYNHVIKIDPTHAQAYFNRALSKIDSGQKESGCLDLSKAGELGFNAAYNTIKQKCN